MSKFVMSFAIAAFSLSSTAFSAQLLCASKKNQDLYFTSGQIRVVATITNATEFEIISLSTTGGDLGFDEADLMGEVKGRYVRFKASDAWCNYNMALPANFLTSKTAPMFLDASCEEGNDYIIRLNCAVK